MAMIKCKECGKEISSNDKFCRSCGNEIEKKELKTIKEELEENYCCENKNRTLNKIVFYVCLIMILFILLPLILSKDNPTFFGVYFLFLFFIFFALAIGFLVVFCGAFNKNTRSLKKFKEQLSKLDKIERKRAINIKILQSFGVSIACFAFIIVVGFCSANSNSDSSSDSDLDYKIDSCSSRTNTYQKCHWSAWENRCVCKFR